MCSRLWSSDSHAAPGEDHGEAGWPPAAHGEAHVRVGTYSLKEIAAHKETMQDLDYPKVQQHMEKIHVEKSEEEAS